MSRIVIVDYGMANLRSVQKAFENVGHVAEISSDPEAVRKADRVVLPGVGAFRDAAAKLRSTGLADVIREHIAADRPFFGVCLGLQLLFDRSHEDGTHDGLGVLGGDVVRFTGQPGLKIPHMGWNAIRVSGEVRELAHADGKEVYFVHSYYPIPADPAIVAATTYYPGEFCCAVRRGNLIATQFHPEKSQRVGLEMLRRFAE